MNPWLTKLIAGGIAAGVMAGGVAVTGATAAFAAPAGGKTAAAAEGGAKDRYADRRAIAKAVFESEADVLGMKPQELRAALKSGKSIEQLAAARGMNKDQFADKLVAVLRPALDKLVDDHRITKAQADHVIDRIQHGKIPFWSGVHRKK